MGDDKESHVLQHPGGTFDGDTNRTSDVYTWSFVEIENKKNSDFDFRFGTQRKTLE